MTNISIRTIHIPATDTSGTRYSATVRSNGLRGQTTITPDISVSDPYEAAAYKLMDKLNIIGTPVVESDQPNGRIFTVKAPTTDAVALLALLDKVGEVATPAPIEVPEEEIGVPVEEDAPAPIQVVTRYVHAEGFKPARIGARGLSGPFSGKRVTVGYDYAAVDPHKVAVLALLVKVGVDGSAVDSGAGIGNGFIYDIVTG